MNKMSYIGLALAKKLKKKMPKSQSINCDIFIDQCSPFKGRIFIPKNKIYKLIVDYPISKPVQFDIKSGKNGLGEIQLINKILNVYHHIYKYSDKYEVWGHGIEDLVLESIKVNHKSKIIKLYVGS